MYQLKSVVVRTSKKGCSIHNDFSGRLQYIQIEIQCNIFIITEIYIASATSVTLSFWIIFVRLQHPNRGSAFIREHFIDYFPVRRSARAIDAFYLLFSRTKQCMHHRCAQSVYRTAPMVKIGFLCLVCQSLQRVLVQV